MPERQGFDAKQLISTLLRRLHIIIAMPILCMLLAGAVTYVLTPRYTSKASILIDPKRQGSIGPDAEFASTVVDTTKVATVTAILESSVLLDRVVKSQRLRDDPEFSRDQPGMLGNLMALIPPSILAARQASAPLDPAVRDAIALDRLRRSTRVVRQLFTYAIDVTVTTSSPAKSQRLAQAISEAYLTDQLEAKYEAAKRASLWLSSRLGDLRAEMLRSEENVERIRQRYNLTETDRGAAGSTIGRQTITELNNQLLAAQSDLSQKQSRYTQIQRSAGGVESLPEATSSGVISQLRGQQGEVNRRLADLLQRYGPQHPEVLRAQEEKRAIDRQIGGEVGRIASTIRNEYESALARKQSVEAQLSRATATEGGAVNGEGLISLREAQQVSQANRALYENFLNKFKDIEQQETRQEAEARIITPAELPGFASFPNVPVLVALGGVGGLAVGIVLAFLLAQLESNFSTATDVERVLGVPVLATIPLLKSRDLKDADSRLDIVQYAATKPLSRFTEGLRSIRVGLHTWNVDKPPRIIQLTSAVPNEGKSTLAAGMAISSAAAGLRTVLIDSDFRHPSASKLFGMTGSAGLVDVLTGVSTFNEVVEQYRDLPLTVLAAGRTVKSPPDLISSQRFRDLVREVAANCDVVIIDSPPVLAISDARIISDIVDSTVLVVEWRSTARDVVAQALSALRAANCKLAGAVLNKVDFSKMRLYGYGYGYGYSYYKYGRYYRASNKYYSSK